MSDAPLCFSCNHYLDDYKCEAFPDGIPDVILFGDIDHKTPVPLDGGIQYKKKNKNLKTL